MTKLEVGEIRGVEARELVTSLYTSEGNGIDVRDDDVFFVGSVAGELVGSVRFCVENTIAMLRTMRVAKKYQGYGYGRELLHCFENYLVRNNIKATYCLPYSHLEKFYGLIGFKPLDETFVPFFLQTRLREYRSRGLEVLCMRREF